MLLTYKLKVKAPEFKNWRSERELIDSYRGPNAMEQMLQAVKFYLQQKWPALGWVNRSPSLLGLCVSPESLHGWLSCLKSPFPPYHEQAWQKLKAALVTWGPSFYLPPDLSSHHCPNNSLSFDLAVSRSHLFLGNQ